MTTTPVAMLIFNRPEQTRRVFEAVRRARPARLLLVADGPRAHRPGEAELCEQTRRVVLDGVDWPCEVQTNLADANLGCTKRVVSGLDWVFDEVDRAIILEDDCLPDPSFFGYCSELLDRYASNEQVMLVSGQNPLGGRMTIDDSYWFSRFQLIWGWASWRRAWQRYSLDHYQQWPVLRDAGWIEGRLGDAYQARCWRAIFDGVTSGSVVDWSFGLTFAAWLKDMVSIVPGRNLVSNIGCGDGGTTTTDPAHRHANLPLQGMVWPLRHPERVAADRQLDRRLFDEMFAFLSHRNHDNPLWRLWYRGKRAVLQSF